MHRRGQVRTRWQRSELPECVRVRLRVFVSASHVCLAHSTTFASSMSRRRQVCTLAPPFCVLFFLVARGGGVCVFYMSAPHAYYEKVLAPIVETWPKGGGVETVVHNVAAGLLRGGLFFMVCGLSESSLSGT